jgi:hypothetical protein
MRGVTDMPLKAYWAYDFACDRPLEDLHAVFNEAGPWKWQLRDSATYGDYLNARLAEGVRVRVHEYPQAGEAGTFVGLRHKGFSALLQIEAESLAAQSEVDSIFRALLSRVNAREIAEIEPYD